MKKFVVFEVVVLVAFAIGVFVGYLWFKPDNSYQDYYEKAEKAWLDAETADTPPVTLDDLDFKRIREVRALYRTVFDKYPGSRWADDAIYQLASRIARTDEEAFILFRRLINNYQDSPWADDSLYTIAMASYQIGQDMRGADNLDEADFHYDRAFALFAQLIRYYPGSTLVDESRVNQAMCHYGKGNLNSALKALNELEEDFRDNQLIHGIRYSTGRIYSDKEEYDNARKQFRNVVLSGHPELAPQAMFAIAQTQFAEKKFEDAIKTYQEVIKSYPKTKSAEDAHFYIGWALEKMKKYDEAIIQLEGSIEKFPHNKDIQTYQDYVARIYYAKNDMDGAIQAYRKVADNSTFDYDTRRSAQFWIGRIYEESEDVNQAVAEYKKLLKNFLEPHRVPRHPSNNISENYIKDLQSKEL